MMVMVMMLQVFEDVMVMVMMLQVFEDDDDDDGDDVAGVRRWDEL